MIYGAAKAIDANYAVRSSPAVVNMLKSLATGYMKDTEELFGDLHSGNFTYGYFYSEMKDLYARQDRSLALHSALGHAEDLISYQQRRAAVDRAMANVRKGLEENCIGCAFSKEDRTGSKGGIAASQKSHGILQSQKISGVNKICQYSEGGSANYVTVKAYEACPASGSRVPPSGNGIFKSSYNNGLNKACVYDKLGSKNVITVGLSESCPR